MTVKLKSTPGLHQRHYMLDGRKLTAEQVLEWHHSNASKAPEVREKIAFRIFSTISEEVQKFLDVGCYSGLFVAQVLTAYPHIDAYGVDSYSDNIDIARLIYPNWSGRFAQMTVYDLKFKSGSLDCVAFKEVIEHIDRPVDAIREINRILRVGGHLLLSTPNANASAWLLFPYSIYQRLTKKNRNPGNAIFFDNVDWNRHIYAWTPKTLNTLLLTNGFEYIDHRFYGRGLVQKMFPEFSAGMIFLLRKIGPSPKNLI